MVVSMEACRPCFWTLRGSLTFSSPVVIDECREPCGRTVMIHSNIRLDSNLVDVIRRRSRNRRVSASSLATTKSISTWGARQIGFKSDDSARV